MSMLRELEELAGVTDRDAFWAPFAKLDYAGVCMDNGKLVSRGFKEGVRELRKRARERCK